MCKSIVFSECCKYAVAVHAVNAVLCRVSVCVDCRYVTRVYCCMKSYRLVQVFSSSQSSRITKPECYRRVEPERSYHQARALSSRRARASPSRPSRTAKPELHRLVQAVSSSWSVVVPSKSSRQLVSSRVSSRQGVNRHCMCM